MRLVSALHTHNSVQALHYFALDSLRDTLVPILTCVPALKPDICSIADCLLVQTCADLYRGSVYLSEVSYSQSAHIHSAMQTLTHLRYLHLHRLPCPVMEHI